MRVKRAMRRKNRKKGFTLIECVVSIAIFAIMGTMFASFMVDSVRVVNLSVTSDADREAILEAIAAKQTNGSYTTQDGGNTVTVNTYNKNGETVKLQMDFGADVELSGDYVTYTGTNGKQYVIYIGELNPDYSGGKSKKGGGSDAP